MDREWVKRQTADGVKELIHTFDPSYLACALTGRGVWLWWVLADLNKESGAWVAGHLKPLA